MKFLIMSIAALALLLPLTAFAQSGDEHWDYRFGIPGTSYYQGVIAVDPRNGDVYTGGDQFTWAGSNAVHNIAKWTRATGKWSALGTGLDNSSNGSFANKMTVNPVNGNLYVAGSFSTAGGAGVKGFAVWNGTTWSNGGATGNYEITSLACHPTTGDLYVGGTINTIGGTTVKNIARWNGSAWSALGDGLNGQSTALCVDPSNGYVYAGGYFTASGAKTIKGFARWNGTTWDSVGGSFYDRYGNVGQIKDILIVGSNIYVTGNFAKIGTAAISSIAKWNGSAWSQVGSPDITDGYGGLALAWVGGELYVGGYGYVTSNYKLSYIARWNGTSWNSLERGINGYASCRLSQFGTYNDELVIAAPQMSAAGPVGAKNYAIWNPTSGWRALGNLVGLDHSVGDVVPAPGGGIYAVGDFIASGRASSPGIAKWDGSSWSAVGKGLAFGFGRGSARRIAVASNGDLYVGGNLSNGYNDDSTKSADSYNILRYSGGKWYPLGQGLDGSANVNAITINGSSVYVGGKFKIWNNNKIQNIARWTGSAWDSLGGGITGEVKSIAIAPNGDLYAGGNFSAAGRDATIKYIAKWNGTAWSALGDGLDGTVSKLLFHGSTLYAAGDFKNSGSAPMKGLAVWNGTAWDTVSTAVQSGNTMAFQGDTLFFGGNVTIADTVCALAYWTGGTWHTLGTGLKQYNQTNYGGQTGPNAIAVVGSDVYFGGNFNIAGEHTSLNIARWNSGQILAGVKQFSHGSAPIAFTLSQNYPNPFNPTTEIRFALTGAAQVRLQVFDLLGREVATLVNERMNAGEFSVPWNASNAASGVYFYRLTAGNNTSVKRMLLVR